MFPNDETSSNTPISRQDFINQMGQQVFKAFKPDWIDHLKPAKTLACIELTTCTAYVGSGCHSCFSACTVEGAIHLVENLPQINAALCTGCGDCISACPTENAIFLRAVS